MESKNTLSLLAVALHATRAQLHQIKALNVTSEEAHGHPLSPSVICKAFGTQIPDTLESLTLAEYDARNKKLQDLLFDLTPPRVEWIEEVRQTEWHATSWDSDASRLFMQSESLGITGTASLAIIAAHMTTQGFPVPNELSRHLHGAKRNIAQHKADLAAAERRHSES